MVKGKPKFAVVCRSFGQPGGTEGWARQQARALAGTGEVDLHVICAEEGAIEGPWKLHTVPTPRVTGFWHRWEFARSVHRVCRRERFDWVHTHDPLPGAHFVTTGPPQIFWALQVRRKWVPGLNDWVQMRLEKQMFAHPNFRLALPMTGFLAGELVRVYPWLAGKVQVLHPTVEGAAPAEGEVAEARERQRAWLGLSEGERLILFVGNNFRHKGLDFLLDALGLEKQAGRIWKLAVVGRGDEAEFGRIAGALGVRDQVRFVGLESGPMLPWYAAADLVAFPSVFETYGLVVPEAMQVGRAVVVTRMTGAAELVRVGATGWVLGERKELAGVLAQAWAADLMGMGAAARMDWMAREGGVSLAEPILEVVRRGHDGG